MKQLAKEEKYSMRQLIEKMREQYHTENIRQKIKTSYSTMDDESVALAEEDMKSYFKQISNG